MKILIVEDNPDSRLVLQKTLEGAGYEVEAAVHGAEALDMARASVPDLIISDILMPVMDGYKLCYALKHDEKLCRVPLVFYTATYVDLEDERLAMGLGASRFMLKPMAPDEFMGTIREVIEEAERGELPVPEGPVDEAEELFRRFDSSLSRKLEKKVRELGLYQRVFDNSSEAIVLLGDNGRISRINKACEALLGQEEASLIGKSPAVYLDERTLVEIRKELAAAEAIQGEARIRAVSGGEIPVWYAIFPVKDESSEVIAQVWVLHDISKRIEAEKQQRLFRTLVDFSNDGIFIIDPESARIKNSNERACHRLGYSLEQLTGKTMLEIDVHFSSMEKWREHVAVLKKKGNLMSESTHRRRDNSEFPVEISEVYTETNDGDYLVGVVRDISERKKAELQLQASRQEWDRTFDAISDVVTIQDLDMRILQANRAASEFFAMPAGEIVGKRCFELFRNAAQICPECPVNLARQDFMPHTAEVEHPNLRKTFQVTMVPILDEDGVLKGMAHFARDVTEQKSLVSQLLQAQKLEAVGKLAGGVAHDFNNLLTVILGYLEIALLRFSPKDPVTSELHQVRNAAERAANLVRQLLLFSRKQPMQCAVIDLNKSIEDLLKMLQRIIGENIHLRTEFTEESCNIMGDAANIDQVVMNLAVNGRDAMPGGGTLSIATEHLFIDDQYVEQNPEASTGDFVRLSVRDTGAGMDETVLQHIFEPFFTTKELGKGTGLGLAVVHGIVKSHKGWITVHSEAGKGTCFMVYFPAMIHAAEGKAEAKEVMREEFRGHGEKILVVEDDEAIRMLIFRVLASWGYGVEVVGDAELALDLIKEQEKPFDLVLSDVVLPGMNGVELAERIRACHPGMPIVLSSGYADQQAHWPRIMERGFPFLEKPVSIAKMLQTIHQTLKPGNGGDGGAVK